MKGVDTIARIRREFFVRGKTIKEIVRELHVSRNTVRKVLRSGATEFTYERGVQPLPKLGRWKEDLDRLLAANAAQPARERLTLIRVFEALRALGRGSALRGCLIQVNGQPGRRPDGLHGAGVEGRGGGSAGDRTGQCPL